MIKFNSCETLVKFFFFLLWRKYLMAAKLQKH